MLIHNKIIPRTKYSFHWYLKWLYYGLDDGRIIIDKSKRFFLYPESTPSLEPNLLPMSLTSGKVSPGVKQLEREADRLPPSNAELENQWTYTFTSPYAFMASKTVTLLYTVLHYKRLILTQWHKFHGI